MSSRMTRDEARLALRRMGASGFETASDDEIRNSAGKQLTDSDVEQFITEAHRISGRPSLTGPGAHSPQLTFRIPETTFNELQGLAERTGKRRSEIVREALVQYLRSA